MHGFLLRCLLLGVGVPALAGPLMIRRVDIAGNSAFGEREIRTWIASREGIPFTETMLAADSAALYDRYVDEGFFDARVDSVERSAGADSTSIALRFHVTEGRRCVVGELSLHGVSTQSEEELLALFETRSGSPLNTPLLEGDIDAVLRRYEEAGRPFAVCTIDSVTRVAGDEADRLNIVLTVTEGRLMTIDEVRVEGNRETRADVVTREIRFSAGELYNPAKIAGIRGRLQRLNIFDGVSEPELYVRDRKGGLLIRVREGSTNTFDGVLGYVPGTLTGDDGYLTGLASVSMRNLFGTGRRFSFRWQREDRWSQELGLRYTEPWLFGQPLNLGGGFLQRKQDTTYVRRVFDLRADLLLTEALTAGLTFSTESVIPSDSGSTVVVRGALVTIGADVQYDTRNDLYSPTSGARYHSEYQYGSRRLSSVPGVLADQVSRRSSVQRYGVDCDFYATVFARQVLALGLHGREVRSGYLDESDMLRLGGARSLRGYREGQFPGSRIAWTTVEYRFLLSRRSFLAGFLDTGYIFRPGDEVRAIAQRDDFKYGYGIGIQTETPIGIIGVSFALGKGDSFSQGKVHFGMINEF